MKRRDFLQVLATGMVAGASVLVPTRATAAGAHTRPIPTSGESIPVIGMGSYITFNVGDDPELLAARTDVLRAFFAAGGGLIDSSPMYGSSEAVIGHCLQTLGYPQGLFSATKVWTWRGNAGAEQMAESRRLWRLPRFDLMQVHNLLGWEDHLPTIRDEREAGLVRYVGVTTSHGRRHDELERLLRREPLDFVQLTYNLVDRQAERRLLPLAADRGIAVIVNRPFQGGALIQRLQRHPLPSWAAEIGCASWPQLLLQFVASHPAVTCVIPATSRVDHMQENMAVLRTTPADAAMRQRMIRHLESL
jgi:diketogulonate reductase-like aldo/keto reductase